MTKVNGKWIMDSDLDVDALRSRGFDVSEVKPGVYNVRGKDRNGKTIDDYIGFPAKGNMINNGYIV